MAEKNSLTEADLAQFTGSEQLYRHSLVKRFCYTDGVKYIAERAGAYWLIDEIAFGRSRGIVEPSSGVMTGTGRGCTRR